MNIVLPVTEDRAHLLEGLLSVWTKAPPGEKDHHLAIVASGKFPEVEMFAAQCKAKGLFWSVSVSPFSVSTMARPDNFLWGKYFSTDRTRSLWYDMGCIPSSKGWADRMEDDLNFFSNPIAGPESLHTTGFYKANSAAKLRAWQVPVFKNVHQAVHLAYTGVLTPLYRYSPLLHLTSKPIKHPDGVELLVPSLPELVISSWYKKALTLMSSDEAPSEAPAEAPAENQALTEVQPARIIRRTQS